MIVLSDRTIYVSDAQTAYGKTADFRIVNVDPTLLKIAAIIVSRFYYNNGPRDGGHYDDTNKIKCVAGLRDIVAPNFGLKECKEACEMAIALHEQGVDPRQAVSPIPANPLDVNFNA